MMVCYISEVEASEIMMEANWGYGARVGQWERPIAEHVYAGMQKAGLRAEIRPAEDSD